MIKEMIEGRCLIPCKALLSILYGQYAKQMPPEGWQYMNRIKQFDSLDQFSCAWYTVGAIGSTTSQSGQQVTNLMHLSPYKFGVHPGTKVRLPDWADKR